MKSSDIFENWEKSPNNLYISKRSYSGNIQPTLQAMDTLDIDEINQFDTFFKSRKKIKNLNKIQLDITKKALSEIFINKKNGIEVYCFDNIICSSEHYANPDSLKKNDYTIMLLSELISSDIKDVLIGNNMNERLSRRAIKFESDRRRKRIASIHKKYLQSQEKIKS